LRRDRLFSLAEINHLVVNASMVTPKVGRTDKNIWLQITLEQLIDAITILGDCMEQLGVESWRLSVQIDSSSSLWRSVIDRLSLDHSEATRLSLYKIWHSNRHGIVQLTEQMIRDDNEKGNHRHVAAEVEMSVSKADEVVLTPDLSLPLSQRPNTRGNQVESTSTEKIHCWVMNETSFVLTSLEWKEAFSGTHQKLKNGWTDIFYRQLVASGIKCSLFFIRSRVKKGIRREACSLFW
jgi:hypothetical protein